MDGLMKRIIRSFSGDELLKIGNRSYINSFRYPESRFDPDDPPMLQPLQDPLRRFSDQVVIPPSYLIFKDAGRVYAKNGRTGQIDFQGIDVCSVVQSAIDAVTATGGGKIFIKAGEYIPLATNYVIYVKSNITLEGEGIGTVFKKTIISLASESPSRVTLRDFLIDNREFGVCLWVAPLGGRVGWGPSDVLIENLVLYGSGSPTIGHSVIEVRSVRRVWIRNCEIAYGGHNGIYIDRTGEGYEPEDILIQDNYIHDNYDDAIDPNNVRNLFVLGNYIVNNELSCLSLEKDCRHVLFAGNFVLGGRIFSVINSRYVGIIDNYFRIPFPNPSVYRIRDSFGVSVIGNHYYRGALCITRSHSVAIIGNHLWNDSYNSSFITITGGVSGLVIKDNYFNSWSEGTNRTEFVHPIVMETTDGANSDCVISDNVFEGYSQIRCKLTGTRVRVERNVVNRRGYYMGVFYFDYDGTMTGTVGKTFTYEPQSGVVTNLPIDSAGLITTTVTFPHQYPTGGVTLSRLDVSLSLANPTASDFDAIVWASNITATGFTLNLKVVTPSSTAGAKTNVVWTVTPVW